MSASLIRLTNNSNPAGGTTSFPYAIISSMAGDLMIVAVELNGTGITVTSVVDNQSSTWVQVPGAYLSGSGEVSTDIWYLANCPAGIVTITVNVSIACNLVIGTFEFSGVQTVSPLDQGLRLDSSGAMQFTTPSFTTGMPGEVLVSVLRGGQVNTGITAPWNGFNDSSVNGGSVLYLVAGAPGAYQGSVTPNNSGGFQSSGASFLAAAGSSPVLQTTSFLVF